ncbi:MAG: RimK family alpha-L-glutamate ligase [Bacilli bacterium]|nr:RimK family alpha-L-glutamate ligase [Bacilli bacterium]
MKGIAILNGYQIVDGVRYVYDRMKEELGKLGVSLDLSTTAEAYSLVDNSQIKRRFDYDFVLFLDKDVYTSMALEKAGIKLFNSAKSIWLCDDKMVTHIFLSGLGIKMPKTISAPLNYSDNSSERFIERVMQEIDFPLVAKKSFGSLGKSVYLINNKQELIEWDTQNRFEQRLYQEFIKSSFGFDYRLIVIGGKFLTGMKRVNTNGDFRSNIALGGQGEKVDIPQSYIDVAERCASALGLDYCGVDLLMGKEGEPILCEVNSNAFMAGIEKITGVNVAGAFAKHIVNQLKQ